MLTSRDRILTTHVGSLPRNDVLYGPADPAARPARPSTRASSRPRWTARCADVVGKQVAAGIDIGNDGEQQRVGFQTYVPARMSGFGGESKRRVGTDFEELPELMSSSCSALPQAQQAAERAGGQGELQLPRHRTASRTRSRASRESSDEQAGFRGELRDGALARHRRHHHDECLLRRHEDYLMALAREMRHEYLAIHEAGLVLQIDAPDLAMERTMIFRDQSDAEFVKTCELHVAAINKGDRGHPARPRAAALAAGATGRGRTSTTSRSSRSCRSLYQANVGALTIEFANPRHAHEYEALRKQPAAEATGC